MQHFSQLTSFFAVSATNERQTKRQSQDRRRNIVSERTNLFSKKKPPYPIESDKAAWSEENVSVVYCSLIWIAAFHFSTVVTAVLTFCFVDCRFFILLIVRCELHCTIFKLDVKNYSQLSAPPVWYSMTRVSKKLRSFFRSIISLIQGNGFSSCSNIGSKPICCARRFAMNRK